MLCSFNWHNWLPKKVFASYFSIEKRTGRYWVTDTYQLGYWPDTSYIGYECNKCKKRKLKQIKESYPNIEQEAYDWLNKIGLNNQNPFAIAIKNTHFKSKKK